MLVTIATVAPSFRTNHHHPFFSCCLPLYSSRFSSTRGVCRKLGQGEVGYVATTHTMSGVYRKWDCQRRNPVDTTWKTTPKNKEMDKDLTKRVVPGASKGQVSKTFYDGVCSNDMMNIVKNRSFVQAKHACKKHACKKHAFKKHAFKTRFPFCPFCEKKSIGSSENRN